jgi:hypothetical protein
MKVLRILLISAGALVVLIAVLAGLAFNSTVQTWAARKALASDPSIKGQIVRLDAGLKQTKLEGVRIEQPGMVLTIPSATVDVPLLAAAREQVHIQRLVAKGWTLDLTATAVSANTPQAKQAAARFSPILAVVGAPQPSASGANQQVAAAFEGIFKLLELPIDLQVQSAELEGDVIFPTKPGQPPGRARVSVVGGGLAPGKTGEFRLQSTASLDGKDAPVRELTADGVLQARMRTPRSFESVSAQVGLRAVGSQVPNGAQLHANLRAERNGSDEQYHFALADAASKQLAEVRATLPAATPALTGNWKLNARDTDLAPFALGTVLPGFVAVGEGQFVTDKSFSEVQAQGRFEAQLDRLEVINDHLRALGRMTLKGDFDVVQHGQAIRVGRFAAEAIGDKPVLSANALQGIELNLQTGELKVADPEEDLVHVKLHGLPLAWAQAFVSDLSLSGDDLKGELVARAENDGVTVRSTSPFMLQRLTVQQKGEPILRDVDVSVRLEGRYNPQGWQADVSEFLLRSGNATWLDASLKAGQLIGSDQPLKVVGEYKVDLPGAVKQPALKSMSDVRRGTVVGDFSAIVATALQQIASKLTVRDVAVQGVDRAIPNLALQLRADVHDDGVIKVQAPLVVQQGQRRSELQTIAELKQNGASRSIDAQVTSELIYVEDVQVLLAPFRTAPGQPEKTPEPQQPGAKQPFWHGVTGEVRMALKKVVYSPDVEAANVTGAVKITPDTLTVDNFRAVMGQGSDARFHSVLNYDAASADAYRLNADLNVTNVNPGPMLALFSPEGKPTVEGHFDVVGKIVGAAPTPEALADRVSADLKLTSRGGRFNGFAASARAADVGRLQRGASMVTSAASVLLGVFGETKYDKDVARVKAISDFIGYLGNIEFDQLNLEVTHRPGEVTRIKDFSLISPDLRLIGMGSIQNLPGVRFVQRPLEVDVEVAVRGTQAENMRLLGALRDQQDPLGYFPLHERVPIRGSLSQISADALMNQLSRYFPKLLPTG